MHLFIRTPHRDQPHQHALSDLATCVGAWPRAYLARLWEIKPVSDAPHRKGPLTSVPAAFPRA